jgi:flagellin-like hook-associated protein FlgL
MTLISDDGYDIVVENYALVGMTGPTMNISGADENYDNLTDGTSVFNDSDGEVTTTSLYAPIELTAGTNPDTVGVSGTLKFHSSVVFSVSTDSQGTDTAPTADVDQSSLATLTTDETTSLVVVPTGTAASVANGSGTNNASATGMTIEFRTDGSGGITTPVRILNMGSGFNYGDVVSVQDYLIDSSIDPDADGYTATYVDITLEHPDDDTITDPITTPGGLFSGNPPGASLSSVSQLDVLNVANSLKMLTAVDGALVRIDLERSDLGATMSRMEHTISNLSNIVMNTKAARSRINDADIAYESTELSKAQVLNQAAQAMLAQANKAQQSILQLLN